MDVTSPQARYQLRTWKQISKGGCNNKAAIIGINQYREYVKPESNVTFYYITIKYMAPEYFITVII